MAISVKRNVSFSAWFKEHVLYDYKSLLKISFFWGAILTIYTLFT